MADKAISDLTQALQITGEDLFVLEQGGEAKKLKGSQVVQYAKDAVAAEVQGVKEYADNAKASADAAAGSSTAAGQKATQAAQSAEDAASAKSAAETAKTDAQAARDAIVNMIVEAVTLETGKPATVRKSLVDNVYKLVFGLPKGETGATGPRGATGNGISDIALKSGNHAPGTSDVYTITLTDGTTFDFAVYNGANGTGAGAGDMLASVYDPQGKHQDIFKYVDDAIGAIPTPDVSGKLDKPANDATATAGQLLTKTADGQEWKDREKDVFVINMITNDGDTIASSDKTFNEVQSALSAKKTVVARLHINRSDTGYIADYELVIAAWFVDESIMFSMLLDNGSVNILMTPQESSLDYIYFQPEITATGLLKGADDGVSAAIAGTDYVAPDGDSSNLTAAFTAASTRINIATGEKLSVLLGKIAKWLGDLKALAFKDKVAKTDLAEDVQQSLDKADSALQSAPVTSVNGKTGAVTVDVPTVPSTTSLIKGNGSGGLVAATRGSDYIASGNIVKQTLVASESTPTENYAINWVYG